jgi:hypothetical protein
VIGVSHIVIDFLKRYIKWKRIFTIDQIAHIAILGIVWFLWGRELILNYFVGDAMLILPEDSRKYLQAVQMDPLS